MKSSEEWDAEYIGICANEITAGRSGVFARQQSMDFIKRVQADALRHAALLCDNMGGWAADGAAVELNDQADKLEKK